MARGTRSGPARASKSTPGYRVVKPQGPTAAKEPGRVLVRRSTQEALHLVAVLVLVGGLLLHLHLQGEQSLLLGLRG